MDLKYLENKLRPAPKEFWMPLYNQLVGMRLALEEAAELYANARKNYREFKQNMTHRSQDSLQKAKEALREREKIFKARLAEWRKTVSWNFRNSLNTQSIS